MSVAMSACPWRAAKRRNPGRATSSLQGGDALNRFFHEYELSDEPSIVPPTGQKVETFLRFTDCDPDESLGILLPDGRAAMIWSIPVYEVLAGCRPGYVPILVGLVEAMRDPDHGVERSGNAPGGETLVMLNGTFIKHPSFDYTHGALRDGFMPNTPLPIALATARCVRWWCSARSSPRPSSRQAGQSRT